MTEGLPLVLHVGCGAADPDKLPEHFFTPGQWREIRFDINPDVAPDIIGSMTDMAAVATASMDAVWSSHNLEHVYPHEVPLALAEFRRVLRPGGFALITLPNLRKVAELVAADLLEEPAYTADAGPITPLDMIYGWQRDLARGNHFMAHKTGFTATTLRRALERAGFVEIRVIEDDGFGLWAKAHAAPD